MLELLIVIALVAILASIGLVSGRRIMLRQEGNSTIGQLRQILSRGGSVASARGLEVRLSYQGKKFTLFEKTSEKVIQAFDVPTSVSINLTEGAVLDFAPSGLIKSLASIPSPIILSGNGKTYQLQLSIIGQMKVTE